MPKLSILIKDIKRYALNPKISDEEFLNAFLGAYIRAGNIKNKNGEELYLDKARVSMLMNGKAEIPQVLRKALNQYGICEKTADNMMDFLEDYINPVRYSELEKYVIDTISKESHISRKEICGSSDKGVKLCFRLSALLLRSVSTNNVDDENKNIICKRGSNIAEIITGDLFHFGFDNRKSMKNIIIIPVNTAFDTHVTRKLEGVSQQIVSENTIHGQWLIRYEQSGGSIGELDNRISNSLANLAFHPVQTLKDTGTGRKCALYNIGAIAVIETNNAVYFLTAISEFDEKSVARSSADNIDKAVKSILELYNNIGQGYALYMPLMGTGRSRAGLAILEAYNMLRKILVNNQELIQGHIYLVVKPEDRNEIEKWGEVQDDISN